MATELAQYTAEANEYYSELWRSEGWGNAQPNEDERLRANAIHRLLNDRVMSSRTETGDFRIVDIGCGRGWLTAMLAAHGTVLGIDPIPAAVERAKSLFPNLTFRIADGADLISEGSENQFDLVVSSEVIEHVVDSKKEEFVRNIYRLLKPGGFAILTTPRGELWKQWKRLGLEEQPVEQWIDEKRLQYLCESAQFRVIARDRVFLPDFSYNWLTWIATRKITRRLISRFYQSPFIRRLRAHCGIYQVILLKRG
jgi:2-polyprenyl-3-methyl-5-hydroxy-6-metoxy-1,4-benzoquinol methylase